MHGRPAQKLAQNPVFPDSAQSHLRKLGENSRLALGSVDLTSITSYFDRSAHTLDDQTSFVGSALGSYLSYGNPLGPEYPASYADAGPGYTHTELHQTTQEFRASSNTPAAPVQWTAGLFFAYSTQFDVLDAHDDFYAVNLFGLAPGSSLLLQTILLKDLQIAAFGQGDYKVTDKLTLTLGVRVARTDSEYTQTQGGPIADPLFPVASGDQRETPVTPKIGVSYQFDDAQMVYASAGKGYRVGGANPPIPLQSASLPTGCPLPEEPSPYKSDSVWSYEVGAKNRVFDGKLSLATSVFHIDWSNIQQNIALTNCGFSYIANTGRATINGFDFNAQAAVTGSLVIGTSVGYTKTRIDNDVYIVGQLAIKTGDVIGDPSQVNSPWDLTGFAKYNFKIADGHDAYVRIEDIYHTRNPGPFASQVPTSPVYAPLIPPNPPTNLTNLRAGVMVSGMEISAFVNNVADRLPALGRFQDNASTTLFTDVTFRPRTAGLSVDYKF
jgi:outer membrane receptor protein involved in Fe transport